MLQVKDAQEVFDEHIRPLFEQSAKDNRQELDEEDLNTPYSIFVLGEMYGTISTCLAQNIPIPKKMWDMDVVKSFVRGDVDDVVVVDEPVDSGIDDTTEEPWDSIADIARQDLQEVRVEHVLTDEDVRAKGFYQSQVENKGLIIIP